MKTKLFACCLLAAIAPGVALAQQAAPQTPPSQQAPAPITTEQEWIANLQNTLKRITPKLPDAEKNIAPGSYNVRVSFNVSRDGAISDAKIASSSGQPEIDQQAIAGLNSAAPLSPFPAAMKNEKRSFVAPYSFIIAEPAIEEPTPAAPAPAQ